MPTGRVGAVGRLRRGRGSTAALFYNRLAPYGQWIWLARPICLGAAAMSDRYWRPYTVGRWVFHRPLWLDVGVQRAVRLGDLSLWPLGILQSGRLVLGAGQAAGRRPGCRGAQSNDYLAWAPLPPASDEGVSIEVNAREVPDYYWQVVPNRDFLSDDLPRRLVRDKNRFNPILRETQPLGNVTITNNNVVVNNVVNVNYIEQKTNEKVVVHKVERAKDERTAGKVQGDVDRNLPAGRRDGNRSRWLRQSRRQIEEVAAESKTKGQAGAGPATDSLLLPAGDQDARGGPSDTSRAAASSSARQGSGAGCRRTSRTASTTARCRGSIASAAASRWGSSASAPSRADRGSRATTD